MASLIEHRDLVPMCIMLSSEGGIYDDLGSVSKLQKSRRYNDIMQKVEEALNNNIVVLEDDQEYELIVACNALLVDIEKEIDIVHNFIRDKYRLKFPELESLVQDSIDFACVVKNGKPFPEDVLEKTFEACDRALVAAKLVGLAGGLSSLANIPACNVQLLGASKNKNFAGFSTQFRVGYMEQPEIFQSTPPPLRKSVCVLLADKSTLAARVDLTRKDPMGKIGWTYCEEIRKKIEKWQEPPPAKRPKPLPVPDKKKRGGRRLRKMKERYAVTDTRKLANRMAFGVPEEFPW
ncbi:RNA splicing factor [Lithospermum erythrorhizon]|uniref:RNA splicing factor n=1 Tax=Lithospermum erythrorhizon TaxID=34254 RepID=A0AAV3Q3T4_LITER